MKRPIKILIIEDDDTIVELIQLYIDKALLVIVLSGVYMILQFERDTLPLYLTLMEQGGTMIILLTIILVSIYSVKLSKKLKGSTLKKDRPLAGITKIYANYLLISTLAGIGIIIVVGLRLT